MHFTFKVGKKCVIHISKKSENTVLEMLSNPHELASMLGTIDVLGRKSKV
jgi:hypothetical protein